MNNFMKRNWKKLLGLLLIALLAFGAYTWYARSVGAARQTFIDIASIGVKAVGRTDMRETVAAAGVVCLKDEQTVYSSAAVASKVKEVLVEIGDTVTEGQEIVLYDAEKTREDLEIKIREAEINLEIQELSLKALALPAGESKIAAWEKSVDTAENAVFNSKTAITDNELKIEQQKQAVAKAESDMADADKNVTDMEILLKAGGVSQEAYNGAVTARRNAAHTLQAAKDALESLELQQESNIRSLQSAEKDLQTAKKDLADAGEVLKDEADRINYEKQAKQIELSRISLENLKKQLNDVIASDVSPISGTVTGVSVERGSQAYISDTDTVLIKVADFGLLIVKANISEYNVPKLALGQPVTMTSDGLAGIVYTGSITKISASATTQNSVSGTETVVAVEICVDNPDGKLRPGFNLDIEILISEKPDALVIPFSAVQKDRETGENYVFAVERLPEAQILRRRIVTLGINTDMQVEAVSGLEEGDEIVTSPTADMQDGQPLARLTNGLTEEGAG